MSAATSRQLAGERSQPLTVSVRKVRIEVVQGPDRGTQVELGDKPLLVGRAPVCGLVLTDGSVSWLHAELALALGGAQIRNLGSRSGVQVGAALVDDARVAAGTCVVVGRSVLALHATEADVELPYSAVQRFGGLVGRSLAMKMVFGQLQRFAEADAPVLIEGPTGTGKQVAARALHDYSPRPGGPFEIIDCGALPHHLIEAELFGADTTTPGIFERAAGGTVVLDEIAELPIELQPKLLGLLERGQMRRLGDPQARPVAARVVATTNRVLAREVQAGRFRQDLYFCLSALRVTIPPLRERKEDILQLVEHFLESTPPLPAAWLRVLEEHDWPGNVRELRNVVERARAHRAADGTPMLDLVDALGGGAKLPPLQSARQAFEKEYLRALLSRNDHNIRRAANMAGLTRQGLYGLLSRNGLRGPSEE